MSSPAGGTLGPIYVRSNPANPSGPLGQLVFPATINVADPAGLADSTGSTLSMTASGHLRVRVGEVAGAIVFPTQPSVLANAVGAAGRVAAPGAGTVIASIAAGSLPAGTYDVLVVAALDNGAPVAATDANNMEFRRGATVVSSLLVLPLITGEPTLRVFRCVLDGATAVSVNATGAATAGVTYAAELIATRIA